MKRLIGLETAVVESERVEQVRGLFDLGASSRSHFSIEVNLPVDERPWQVGLITGPSGSGKSTVAREAFRGEGNLWLAQLPSWPEGHAVVDGFPEACSIKEVTALLSSVGFSSPPAWLRPYRCLSTGQQFRCDLARLLACLRPGETGVFDEYTSVVDRVVAQVGSAAVGKAIRRKAGVRFVAVTCHEDVEEWLQPDWVYRPETGMFCWRSVQPRPRLVLEVSRCTPSSWRLFAPHHYLSDQLNAGSWCWLAWLRGRPVAFSAWLPFVGSGPLARREHRTVVLPDYQGVGIGQATCELLGSMWKALGYVVRSTTTHPGLMRARAASKNWRVARQPSLTVGRESGRFRHLKHATTRLTAGFEYVGPAMDRRAAQLLFDG